MAKGKAGKKKAKAVDDAPGVEEKAPESKEPVIVADSELVVRRKGKIKAAFSLFDKEGNGTVAKEEVGSIMRYLGVYPDELHIAKTIVPVMTDDEPTAYVTYPKFESVMLAYIERGEHAPDSDDTLLQAFRVLDPEHHGFIAVERMEQLLTSMGTRFRTEEVAAFKEVAVDKETGRIYYEDYIALLVSEAEAAVEGLS